MSPRDVYVRTNYIISNLFSKLAQMAAIKTVPNMGETINDIKGIKKMLPSVKLAMDNAIKFYNTMHSQNSDDVDGKIKEMLDQGYHHLFTVTTMLEMFAIKEDNQSNKIIYDDARESLIPIPVYTNILHDIIRTANTFEIENLRDMVKVKSKESSIETEYSTLLEKVMKDSNNIKNNYYNNHVNVSILSITKARAILDKMN